MEEVDMITPLQLRQPILQNDTGGRLFFLKFGDGVVDYPNNRYSSHNPSYE